MNLSLKVTRPYLLEFPEIGAEEVGFLAVAESSGRVPFAIKRVFWTVNTPESVLRGRHAHHVTEQILIAAQGRILVTTEQPDGQIALFVLDHPNQGVYVPPNVWHTMQYSANAVQMALASTPYLEEDYIRDYAEFKAIWK
ncbi:FdtA/QdtA family cupin domain-containing protein [Rufibacter sp. LB8]|uniref:sugar 3,4-ketoisomerase n=1 Tax=Rufibacter sp. LB8 TaxID=2777781 RepID=UPI00178C7D58|nr:FdtA/QdtA family cupin domain-containing protein [Rufibacter sp. LB8]